jgi:thiamine biosynthesis protein ThiI
MNAIVIHYKELALKGRNRPWFVHRLIRNLRTALEGLDVRAVRSVMGRVEIELGPGGYAPEVRERIGRIFGIANFSRAGRTSHDFETIAREILHDLQGTGAEPFRLCSPEQHASFGETRRSVEDAKAVRPGNPPSSFRVSVRRADKRIPFTSPQIEREVGGLIKQATGWHVNLSRPALTIHVEMLPDHAAYFFGKEPGAGGLPTGSGGRVACLLSGGIDSPVAAYRLMRRGCSVMLIHFHSYPILSRASQDKVRQISELLTRSQLRSRLVMVPFGDLQQQVLLNVTASLRVVIYRRLMLRIAERLARAWHARALVTGEVIGQVASQTLDNLTTIGEATSMQVLRPLVGMDKDEIIAEAERIGTLPISHIPDQDCCQLFTPKYPATNARRGDVLKAEETLPIEEMVERAVAASSVERFRFPMLEYAADREAAGTDVRTHERE